MKKRAILILGVALLIAAAGVVYAHWTETLTVDATVNTGSITLHWKKVWTNDDGIENLGFTNFYGVVIPNDGEPFAPTHTYIGDGTTSADPSSIGFPATAGRYDKDVANCEASINTDAHGFTLTVSNAYPSYHCTIFSTFGNQGTVPVKVQSVTTTVTKNGLPWDGTGAEWDTKVGTGCGLQIDPGETYYFTTVNWVHILNDPTGEDDVYVMHQTIDFVNWNEWSANSCGTLPIHTP